MSALDLAVIGNCSFGALLDGRGRLVWSCLPRFDGDPVFCALLAGNDEPQHGFYDVDVIGFARAEQTYERNSASVVTTLHDQTGGVLDIVDFAPRFKLHGRLFRPITLVRRILPRRGAPRIRIRLRPTYDYGRGTPERTRGSNHVRYVNPTFTLRLTTDAPITYVVDEVPFVLDRPLTLILGPDETLLQSVAEAGRDLYEKTLDYWHEWVRYLSLPFEWQEAVIRAAITLKLCNFEETGAIIAAMTTSIPEAPNTARTWDYRFCWLRDSFFVVHALNRLGATATMEGYLSYIANIVAGSPDGHLQPVYGIAHEATLSEAGVAMLPGYRGMGPVRVGNHAYAQVQNDGYGSVILASAQSFFDQRLVLRGDEALFRTLEKLGEQAARRWDQPDAGLWELRTRNGVHTFSSMMCWAACDRLARIANQLGLGERAAYWHKHAERIQSQILSRAWNAELGSFAASFGGDGIDASLLLMPELGFLKADDPRFLATLKQIEQRLKQGRHVFRYAAPDDFGQPESAFNVCTFWYIDALVRVGRRAEARELFEHMLTCRNPMGLLSEDIDPKTEELWGNIPQTYSMVGLINSAMRLSKPWEQAF